MKKNNQQTLDNLYQEIKSKNKGDFIDYEQAMVDSIAMVYENYDGKGKVFIPTVPIVGPVQERVLKNNDFFKVNGGWEKSMPLY